MGVRRLLGRASVGEQLAQRMRCLEVAFAIGAHDEEALVVVLLDQMAKEQDGRSSRPVQVLHHEHQRVRPREPAHQCRHGVEQLESGQHRLRFTGVRGAAREQSCQRARPGGDRSVERLIETRCGAERHRQRLVRHIDVAAAQAAEHDRAALVSELGAMRDEAGLADSGLATHQHQPGSPRSGFGPLRPESVDLPVAADQWQPLVGNEDAGTGGAVPFAPSITL